MDTSIFLAKLIGPILAVIGLGLLINRAGYQAVAEEVVKSRVQLWLSGVLALTAGLAIVLSHNEWDLSWEVIITVIGWLAILRGLLRLLIPQQIRDFFIACSRPRTAGANRCRGRGARGRCISRLEGL